MRLIYLRLLAGQWGLLMTSPSLIFDLIYQGANFLDVDSNITSILQSHSWLAEIPYSGWRTCEKDGPCFKSRALRQVRNLLLHVEDHIAMLVSQAVRQGLRHTYFVVPL